MRLLLSLFVSIRYFLWMTPLYALKDTIPSLTRASLHRYMGKGA